MRLTIAAVPLDEDRALVAAVGDDAVAVARAHAEVHGALHAEEPPGGKGDRAGEQPLDQ